MTGWCTQFTQPDTEPQEVAACSRLSPWPLPYLALCVHPVADTKPSWRQSTLALAMEKSSSQMVPHSPLWKSSTRPSLCFRGYPASRTFSRSVWGRGDGDGAGAVVAAPDVGVVWVKQQGKHSPNRRLNANRCTRRDFSIASAAREEKTKGDVKSVDNNFE